MVTHCPFLVIGAFGPLIFLMTSRIPWTSIEPAHVVNGLIGRCRRPSPHLCVHQLHETQLPQDAALGHAGELHQNHVAVYHFFGL